MNCEGDNAGLVRKERARDWNSWLFIGCVPYMSEHLSLWQAMYLVQTVFSRKGNNPSNHAGYRVNCSVFMKYPG